MITMKDVANKAGVSQATVSRVLNGSTGVSRERRSRVMEWVRKLNFEPNLSARSLAANRSHLIGVILPDLLNPYFAEILAHIEKISSRNGYSIILANTDGDPGKEKAEFTSLKARQVDGFLVVPSPGSMILDELETQTVHAVVATQDIAEIDCVAVSHYQGGALIAEHFLETGIRKFAFLGHMDDDKYRGYFDTLTRASLTDIDIIMNENWWLNSFKRGYKSTMDYLGTKTPVSRLGVFASNDSLATGAVLAVQDMGYSIPNDIAIAGFDDTYICESIRPSLTSIHQPVEDIGRLAVETLLKKIEGFPDNSPRQHIVLEPQLARRESS